jgi:uncharacterized protein
MKAKAVAVRAAALLFAATMMNASAADLRLVEAIKQQNRPAVRALLKQRVDVNVSEGDGATALHWAAYVDDLETADLLIKAGARVNAANDLGVTPLALAGANGNAALLEKLLLAGANPDAASEVGVTPLMEAARVGSAASVRTLLSHEANVNARDRDRDQTALMWAVSQRHPDVVRALLEGGADVQARTRPRTYRIMLDQGPKRVVKTSKQDATSADLGGNTALLFAAQVGDAESASLLLKAGAKVNDASGEGNSALVIAALSDQPEVAAVLIDSGADVNAAGGGYTALHAAVIRSNETLVKNLLAHGANPDIRVTRGSRVNRFGLQWAVSNTLTGATPLFVAACYLEVEIMHALLAAGASPLPALPDRTSALHVVAGIDVEHQTRPADRVERGDGDSENARGSRPENRVIEAAKLLLDAGADSNAVNETGDTAMHGAAAAGLTSVIQLRADRVSNLEVKTKKGQTPLALTSGGMGTEGQPAPANARPAPGLQKAQELLKKLGAAN